MKKAFAFFLLSFYLVGNAQPGNIALRSLADPELKPFYHGVASGDPTATSVIIWTRVTPETDDPVEVRWKISKDTTFSNILQTGVFTTSADRDYTVKIDVGGLEPSTWYYYEFSALEANSVIGRTKTAPEDEVDQLRFAVVSCSKYRHGYFNVYDKIYRRNDIDAVIHLGDYIYEEPGNSDIIQEEMPRNSPPDHELIILNDYRIRHSVHKLDRDSRKMHQNYPLIAVWDDHESCDNSWRGGADNHEEAEDGPWDERLAASIKAYYEWMPIRIPDETDNNRIFRKFSYGDLADIYMVDTRIYDRDLQAEDIADFDDPDRRLMGPDQMQWLQDNMLASTAKYQILGQQVVMAPLVIPDYQAQTYVPINNDQWDGYTAERTRLYDFVLETEMDNLVVLTGDIHTGWANDLPYDIFNYNPSTGAGSVGVEFVCNSVTSNSIDFPFPLGEGILQALLPYIKYVELYKKGYVILDLNNERAQGDFYIVSTVEERNTTEFFQQGWYAPDGIPHLVKNIVRSEDNRPPEPLAPCDPRTFDPADTTITGIEVLPFDVLGIYPNPFIDVLLCDMHLFADSDIEILLYDSKGSRVYSKDYGQLQRGRSLLRISLPDIPPGVYELKIISGSRELLRKVVRTANY